MTDIFTQTQRSRIMSRIHGADTAPELAVRSMAHKLGYRFRLHRRDLPGTPDLVFPGRGKVIFVHGCFWHLHPGCPKGTIPRSNIVYWREKLEANRRRDRRVQRELRRLGWQVLIVWQCQLRVPERVLKKLERFLGEETAISTRDPLPRYIDNQGRYGHR